MRIEIHLAENHPDDQTLFALHLTLEELLLFYGMASFQPELKEKMLNAARHVTTVINSEQTQ